MVIIISQNKNQGEETQTNTCRKNVKCKRKTVVKTVISFWGDLGGYITSMEFTYRPFRVHHLLAIRIEGHAHLALGQHLVNLLILVGGVGLGRLGYDPKMDATPPIDAEYLVLEEELALVVARLVPGRHLATTSSPGMGVGICGMPGLLRRGPCPVM